MNLIQSMAQNKHTSAAAVVGFITQAVPIFWPELQAKCDALFKLAIIYGFARAGDATGGQATPADKSQLKLPLALWLCGGLLCCWMFTGCAQFSTKQTDTSYEDGKPTRTITTQAKATTIWESKSALANFKASQTDKTQSATVGSLNQDSGGTNTAATVNAVTELLRTISR